MKLGKNRILTLQYLKIRHNINLFLIYYRLELNMELPNSVQNATIGASTQVSQEQDELTQRLARLRQAE